MPWSNTPRLKHVPTHLRNQTLNRDSNQCTAQLNDGTRCAETEHLEIDHILNLARGGTTELDNLQTLCNWHHKRKTAREANTARIQRTTRRPDEKHPGLR